MPHDIQTLLAKIETAMAEAREVIREAHVATKDAHAAARELRAATAEARKVYDAVPNDITEHIRTRINAELEAQLQGIHEQLRDMEREGLDKVFNEVTAIQRAIAQWAVECIHEVAHDDGRMEYIRGPEKEMRQELHKVGRRR